MSARTDSDYGMNRHRLLTRAALFAALMSVSAFIRIPLGPVPLTMQTFVALVAGYSLGPAAGAASMTLYVAVGLAGLPVFSTGGGPAYILSPTFGYLIGFIVSAAVTGSLARLNRRHSITIAYLLMLPGIAAIYIPGLLWLSVSLGWIADIPKSMSDILKMGLLIPLPGDLLTALPAAYLSVRLRKMLA